MRQKKCKACKEPFQPQRPMQTVCSPLCGLSLAKQKREKAERKEIRVRKEKLKSRSDWLKDAQTAVNAYIRARDKGKPCISCGRDHQGQYHAGHYRSVGSCPELRFDERNIFKQCQPCNTHLHGNLIEYRRSLLAKFGRSYLRWLEGPHELKKYTIDDLKQIIQTYRQKLKDQG